jgi:hypothetical protein
MKNKALALAELGFRVFPLKDHTEDIRVAKEPRKEMTSWQTKATSDKRQIKAWWDKYPNANIGVVPGPEYVVIDIDSYKPQGRDSAIKLNPPSTLGVKTARGGLHLWYKHPGGGEIGNQTKEWESKYPGIEIRADKGYVLGPGSVAGGKEYHWHPNATPDITKISSLPPVIIKLFPFKNRYWQKISLIPTDNIKQSALVLPETIAVGERDNTLFRYICGL